MLADLFLAPPDARVAFHLGDQRPRAGRPVPLTLYFYRLAGHRGRQRNGVCLASPGAPSLGVQPGEPEAGVAVRILILQETEAEA